MQRPIGAVDAWAEFDGPIGPLYVAWGPAGITTVERAGDAAGFELDAMLRTGRPVSRVARLPDDLARQIARQLAGEWQPIPAARLRRPDGLRGCHPAQDDGDPVG